MSKTNGQKLQVFKASDGLRSLVVNFFDGNWSAHATSSANRAKREFTVSLDHQRNETIEAAFQRLLGTLSGWGEAWVELGQNLKKES